MKAKVTVAERRFMVAATITLAAGGAFGVAWRGLAETPTGGRSATLSPAEAPPPRRGPRRLPGPPPDGPLGEEPRDVEPRAE